MQLPVLLVLANVVNVLAVPAGENEIVADQLLPKRATTTTKANPVSSIVSAFCTNPGSNFNPAILLAASEFCTRFLNIKPSTVLVTSGTAVTVTGTATGPSVIVSTISTSVTVTITPSTTVTIPSTFTEPGTTETYTAPRSTITVVKTNTITAGTRKTVYTRTVTQTTYVAKRADGAPSPLANNPDSVVSTVCKCLAKTPTVTRTTNVGITKTVNPTASSISTSFTTVTNTVTSELEEFTKSIFTTVTLPGEEETITVSSAPTTITKTTTAIITTTETIKTDTTKTTKVRTSTRKFFWL